jgi:hypothetical protein
MIWQFREWQVICLKQILTNATHLKGKITFIKDVFLRKRSRERFHARIR